MNHLEKLTRQYYDWQGYIVKGNIKVRRLSHGGWGGELDIVAYHPTTKHLVHIEPSLDADSWATREKRFYKKFKYGRDHIYKDVFPWLSPEKTQLEQIAILVSSSRKELSGGKVISIDEFTAEVREKISAIGIMRQNAIAEEYDLLRTIQLTTNGYSTIIPTNE